MAEQDKPYSEGTVKLTWIDPMDNSVLHSRMYNSEAEAKGAVEQAKARGGNRKNWMMFELSKTDGNQYEWKLLPQGNYKKYLRGMKLDDKMIIKVGVGFLMLMGVIYLGKLGYGLLKKNKAVA